MCRRFLCVIGVALWGLLGCASQQAVDESMAFSETGAERDPLVCEQTSYVKTDRYTLANASPLAEQREPMAAIVHMRFAQDVSTVGQAVRELLEGSGYRLLVGEDRVEMQDQILLAQRLPAVHQELGPVSLLDALSVLGGRAWQVNVDHVYRLVWFKVSDDAGQASVTL